MSAMMVFLMLALCSASAQTLQFRFSFEDSGTSVTSGPDGALGSSITLNTLNFSGTAADFHGGANSGVQGAGQSLNFSSAVNAGTAANSTINGPIAQTLNNTAFAALGTVSNFTATLWIKQFTSMTNTQSRGPRLMLFGPGVTDNNSTTNDISLYFQVTNTLYFKINNTIISPPIYYNPLPTNVWLFIALAYDGTNGYFYMGSEATPAKLLTVSSNGGLTVNFGASANLLLGNRSSDRARAFSGWFDEVRFYTGSGDANFVENIRQMSTPMVVSSIYPDGLSLMEGTNQFSMAVASSNGIPTNGVTLFVNGTNVSSGLFFGGTSNNLTVSYTGLPVNNVLPSTASLNAANISLQIVDSAGITTTNSITYDTFSTTNFTWEAEDYDFGGGVFIDNPVYAFTSQPNSYYQTSGNPGVDYSDNGAGPKSVYRSPFDLVETEYSVGNGLNGGTSVGELMRQKIRDAYALDPTIRDVDMGHFDGPGTASGLPNWVNYTRTFPAGAFNVYTRVAFGGTSGGAILSQVTNNWGTGSPGLLQLGTFSLPNTGGWQSYAWVPLRDSSGNLVRVDLPAGTNTFQFTAGSGGGGNENFLMLSPANTNVPILSAIYPNGTNLMQFSTNLSFVASSPSGVSIATNSIVVQLRGTNIFTSFATNITATNGLLVTGTATNLSVSCPLAPNTTYTAVISVTDANGNPAISSVSFDTYNPSYTWEAEDYNYSGGQAIYTAETNGYLGFGASDMIDTFAPNFAANTGAQLYRSAGLNTEVNGDGPRLAYIGTGFTDYDIGYNNSGNWGNYSRSYPSGVFNIVMRGANGSAAPGSATLALVSGDTTSTNQTTANIGTFTVPATGNWQGYTWVPLRDNNGNLAQFNGIGSPLTLRVTSGSGYNANFYALLPANTNVPLLSNITPPGTNMFESTNTLSFTASSSAGIAANSISVMLNGVDISSNITIGGTLTARTVTYPHLQPNTSYTVVINVRDGNGNPAATTINFDTFSAANYTWEAEDFDHDGGQFTDNPQTNAYSGLGAVTDVDAHQVNFAGTYLYRTNGCDTEVNGDQPRAQYQGTGFTDYTAGYFSDGAWMNYTRHYPTGTYNVYGRMATGGGADSSCTLAEVTSGWGTTNQTLGSLGTFSVPFTAWESYTFVPLRDDSGNLVSVTFNGSTNTLQVGRPTPITLLQDVNVNFLMLVPVFNIQATPNGANLNLSFATQSGFKYQVQYKTNLTDVGWISLGSAVSGNGTVKSVSDSLAGTHRFYRVAIQ
ncbi:MAG TPA: hypothetical protein VG754_06275 [Verrucomicrobiae bacterium]|nr:hypothetical protein [Verrucomicrobiae bacterium]